MKCMGRFDDYAATYDGLTPIQKDSGKKLLSLLYRSGADFHSVLDLGCGTGRLLHRSSLEYQSKHLFGIDHSNSMLKKAAHHLPLATFLEGEIEKTWGFKEVSTVFSNFALQWIPSIECSLPQRFEESNAQFLGVAMPVEGSLRWLSEHAESILGKKTSFWNFQKKEFLLGVIKNATLSAFQVEDFRVWYPSMPKLLKVMQQSGVVPSKVRFSTAEVRRLYQSLTPIGACLDFKVAFYVWKKEGV